MATEKEHQRNTRCISKTIKAIDAQIRKNKLWGTGYPSKIQIKTHQEKATDCNLITHDPDLHCTRIFVVEHQNP